jgi:transposase
MNNRQSKPLINNKKNLTKFFEEPASERQRHYEAVRAIVIEKLPAIIAAEKFGYKVNTLYALIRDARSGKLKLFPEVKKGPKKRSTPISVQEKIIQYRKENLSSPEITERLINDGNKVSTRTVERILYDAGFKKLKRRTNVELGITKKNKIIPERSKNLDFNELEPFNIDCSVAGVFFFLPYIIESGIIDIVQKCKLPKSGDIDATQACLSMLFLKLIGNKRLSHMDSYDQEPGLGIFAGLNILPKSTYMSNYSCLTSETMLLEFQQEIVKCFRCIYPDFYVSQFINLDFHSIPHYGDQAEMEKIWCGSRGKAMKAANTIFAQDNQSNVILYTRTDILRKEEAQEIKKFIRYWKEIKGALDEILVFDCKFTKYKTLDELTNDGIKFITLRKRTKKLIENTMNIPEKDWQKVNLPILKRKYKRVSVYEEQVIFEDCQNTFRQIIVTGHGRKQPTYIITNDKGLSLLVLLEVYSKRWHIENKLSELVTFFNLNALSSPLMIRIHFDILWTLIADTLYHRFAQDLRRFENILAPTIFKKFINMPGRVVYDGKKFVIKIRKRAHTPILKGVKRLNKPIMVPWLDNRTVEIVWTP